jgi:hypothetical protein
MMHFDNRNLHQRRGSSGALVSSGNAAKSKIDEAGLTFPRAINVLFDVQRLKKYPFRRNTL